MGRSVADGAGLHAAYDAADDATTRAMGPCDRRAVARAEPVVPIEVDAVPTAEELAAGLRAAEEAVGHLEAERRDPTPPGGVARIGRLEVVRRLGQGGMAQVVLARDPKRPRGADLVAVKYLLPQFSAREDLVRMFLDEARLASRLRHPNVARVHGVGHAQGQYFLVMEYVDGISLADLMRRAARTGGVPAPIAVRLAAQVAEALHYAHRARDEEGRPLTIVHRDVSPQNIMIAQDGVVKLLDFGIAKALEQASDTRSGVVKGKFAYMAPEQCLGRAVDPRTDLFALGVCLYELLTGRPLYHRKSEYECMRAITEEPPPSPRRVVGAVPLELDRIVTRLLAKEPGARFQSAGEVQNALEEHLLATRQRAANAETAALVRALFPPGLQASTPGPAEPSVAPRERRAELAALVRDRPWPVAATLAVLTMLTAAALGLASPDDPPPAASAPTPALEARVAPRVGPAPTADPRSGATGAGQPAAPPVDRGAVRAAPLAGPAPPVAATRPSPSVAAPSPSVAAPSPSVAAPSPSASAPSPRRPAPGPRPRASPAAARGTLSVNTTPWSRVFLDGRLLGTTPLGGVRLPVGRHELRMVDASGRARRHAVEVRAGEETRVSLRLGPGT